jgi:TRAP-type mannitol/chloroaromatic compound transport system permease large subunit
MFCAAIPVTGAVGAKLNADRRRQLKGDEAQNISDNTINAVTTGVIFLLLVGSVIYHTTYFGK